MKIHIRCKTHCHGRVSTQVTKIVSYNVRYLLWVRRNSCRNNGRVAVSWNRWELYTVTGSKELCLDNNIVSHGSGFSVQSQRDSGWFWAENEFVARIRAAQAINWKAVLRGKRLGSSQEWVWNHRARLTPPGPSPNTVVYTTDPVDSWLSQVLQALLPHPWNLCSAHNCHHVQRGTSSALFASLATDLGHAGASQQQNLVLFPHPSAKRWRRQMHSTISFSSRS